ncbi:MAG: nucleotidyltransferase domain-containing protein [Candidatus Brockarchaeota archaeon]|nr:nucleotidyltransferase domain-containing protein [Candidatus Brockarchaeota archaeon]
MSINYYHVSLETISERLREIINRMPDVKIAVLFGSVLTRNSVRDLDVGVFIGGEPNFKRIVEIAGALEDYTGIPVDVVPLNKAPPMLRLKALSKGVRLVVRDSKLYALLLSEAFSEAVDVDLKLRSMRSRNRDGGKNQE